MRHSGVLIQTDAADARLAPVERLRAAVADCMARHGWRPAQVLVNADGAWPGEVDGVPVVPSPAMAYPTWMMLVKPPMEDSHVIADGR